MSPICGSDGITYGNECLMKMQSCHSKRIIDTKHIGSCGKRHFNLILFLRYFIGVSVEDVESITRVLKAIILSNICKKDDNRILGIVHYLCLRLRLKRNVYLGNFFCYPTLCTIKIIATHSI